MTEDKLTDVQFIQAHVNRIKKLIKDYQKQIDRMRADMLQLIGIKKKLRVIKDD